MRPLPSAGVALYRREGWREGGRKRAGDDGKVKEAKQGSHLFRLPIVPRAPSIFDFWYCYWDTQQEPLRRRELCAQRNQKLILELAQPNKVNITTTLPLIQTDFFWVTWVLHIVVLADKGRRVWPGFLSFLQLEVQRIHRCWLPLICRSARYSRISDHWSCFDLLTHRLAFTRTPFTWKL